MSVVKSKHDEGRLLVLTKANELATYTIKICSNDMSRTVQTTFCGSSFKLRLSLRHTLSSIWR